MLVLCPIYASIEYRIGLVLLKYWRAGTVAFDIDIVLEEVSLK